MIEPTQDLAAVSAASEHFIAETGGLPEITRAATDLRSALDQTAEEIEVAEFASRFPRQASDYFLTMMNSGDTVLTAETRAAIEAEGEAGHKRVALRAGLRHINSKLSLLITELVELRCDLVVSQDEMSGDTPTLPEQQTATND